MDRSDVLRKWTAVLQEVDAGEARVKAIRDKILGAIAELRVRQVGLSEEMLVGSYAGALKALNRWLDDLEHTINRLRASIGAPGV